MARKKALIRPAVRYRFQYAAKFLCTANVPGTSQTTSALLPGVYQTAVNIHSPQRKPVELRTKLGPGVSECASIVPVYRGANWMERECFDMFGVRFVGHPDLRRILLGDDWVGHPLLKSYAVDTPHPPYR